MRVVIAGLGDTGLLVATRLSRHHEVVGVTTKPMFVSGQELGSRLARTDVWRRDYLHEYGDYRRMHSVDVVHGQVVSADLNAARVRVDLAEGRQLTLAYDAFVIATGTTNGFWRTSHLTTRRAVEQDLRERAEAVRSARTIAVVGGGPSGVNVASQVADVRPDADVRLYHSGDQPLPDHHPRARRAVVRRLEAQGVSREPGHRAIVPPGADATLGPATIRWASGQDPVTADLVVWAVGDVRPSTSYLPESVLDDEGFVRVHPTLRVVGCQNVFAIGDVAASDPLRNSARNFGHRIVAHNVRRLLEHDGVGMRRYRAPEHRWGSILGLQSDGIRIYTPAGRGVRLRPPTARQILFPWLTHRLLYGGLRADRDERER